MNYTSMEQWKRAGALGAARMEADRSLSRSVDDLREAQARLDELCKEVEWDREKALVLEHRAANAERGRRYWEAQLDKAAQRLLGAKRRANAAQKILDRADAALSEAQDG